MGQTSGGPCHVMLGPEKSKKPDKKDGRYDSKTGAAGLQVTPNTEISQNLNRFNSPLSPRPELIKKSIFLISFPIDVWE